MADIALEARGLTKVYGEKRALDSFDMCVRAGDIYGFVGRNGAGKSTLMKVATGLADATSGQLSILGDVLGSAEMRHARKAAGWSRVGSLIEAPGVLPNTSVRDNLMLKARTVGVRDAGKHCADLIELVGLTDASKKSAKALSLGMRQRLGLAMALVGKPDLLLLDEPFNGLDPETTRALRTKLVELNHERGVTIVVSSHVLGQLTRMATRFGVINAGHMGREFTIEELTEACENSVHVRTADSQADLAALKQRLPKATFRTEVDGGIVVAGEGAELEDVARALHDMGAMIYELSPRSCDEEEFFISAMHATAEDFEKEGDQDA